MLDIEKLRPFECGFIPQTKPRSPFSIHFFLVSIIFLIFDVELVLLFPYILGLKMAFTRIEIFIIILALLTWGTALEWSQTMLDWSYKTKL